MKALRWFKRGTYGLVFMAIAHFVTNAKGLPIPTDTGMGRELVKLMADYKIDFFGLHRTLDQTFSGYAYTWGVMLLGIAAANLAIAGLHPAKAPPAALRWINVLVWGICTIISVCFWSYPQMGIFAAITACFMVAVWPAKEAGAKRPPGKKFDPKVAVIGAGPAGLTVAWNLRKQGYNNVTVFEKLNSVGGKCLTKKAGEFNIDVGAHEMLAGYTEVMAIADELGVPSHGHQKVLVYNRHQKEFFSIMNASTNAGYTKLQIGWAAIRYTWMLLTRYRKFSKPGTGLADAPAELHQPVGSWLREMKLEPLREIVLFIMTVQCYGRSDEIAAAYFVKFQGFKNWTSNVLHSVGIVQRWPRVFTDGFQDLWAKVAAKLDNVRVGADITSIRRSLKPGSEETGIEISCSNNPPEMFDRLVLASPHDITTLEAMGLDLDDQERDLFSKIKYNTIIATSVHVEGIPEGVVGTIPLPAMLDYTGYIKVYRECDVVIFFAVSPTPVVDKDEVYQRIVDAVAQLPTTIGVPPKVTGKFFQEVWPYFPHPSLSDMAAGYFDQLRSLQGHRNTFYAGSLLEMETVGNTVANAQHLTKTQFPPLV
jgi:oxygen-dependent protoporphyrinogen oxidase